jgi:DNA-binding response OmpR family regulator
LIAKKILIADDDCDLVHALAVRCRRLGLNVSCAHDAFSALSLVKTERPDMVCLDVDMPSGNGLSVCEMLSTDESCRSLPIAILTGKTDPATIMRCHSLCAYYVEKCPDVWGRIEPLIKELLFDPDTSRSGNDIESPAPAAHDPLHR